MEAAWSRKACARWTVIVIAALFAAAGCQSVATTRGQNDLDIPFPEAERGDMPDPFAADPAAPEPGDTTVESLPEPAPRTPQTTPTPTEQSAETLSNLSAAGPSNPPMHGAPSELCMTTLPTYVLEPPDVLLIEAVRLVPKPPYRIEPLDILQIVVLGTLLGQDIQGLFVVDPSGLVDLGPAYGKVHVAGLSIDEATRTIHKFLQRVLREPEVSVVLAQMAGQQQIAGEHLIGPDGMINLGSYGSVYVSGMTIAEAKEAVERHLSKYLQDPLVSLDVFSYQSKVYYVISQGAGLGDGVTRVPITGNETVLDAIAQVNGISRLASKKIWIARPVPGGHGCDQILKVNYNEITAGAATATNYQILPGDRVFIAEDKLIAIDSFITKVTAPFERMFGFTLLGAQTVQSINRFPLGLGGF